MYCKVKEIEMTAGNDVLHGGCSCGNVRYKAVGVPDKVCYCHCNSCRRATGAPVAAVVMFEASRFCFTSGKPRYFSSSPGVLRGFCQDCGTPLSWAGSWYGQSLVFVYIGTVDDPESVQPDRHAFCGNQLNWFDTADELPRFSATSPPGVL